MKRIIVIVLIIAVVLLAAGTIIGFVGVRRNSSGNDNGNTNVATINGPTSGVASGDTFGGTQNTADDTATVNTRQTSPTLSEDAAILRTARLFIERYGTFSSNNNFENIRDLFAYMTQGFQTRSERFIADSEPTSEYYGITTQILTLEMEKKNTETATVLLVTRRDERAGASDPRIFTQRVHVSFVKEDGGWNIDDVRWE